jgi:hypothetical protein
MKTLKLSKKLAFLAILYLSLISSFGLFAQELQFAKSFGGQGGVTIMDIDLDSDGNIYMIGTFAGTIDADPDAGVTNLTVSNDRAFFLTKSNSEGALIWAKQFAAGSDQYLSAKMTLDASGNIFVTGNFSITSDFDPGTGNTTLEVTVLPDIFFARFDTNGNLIWVKNLEQPDGIVGSDYARDIDLDASGNIIIVGSAGQVDFDPGPGVVPSTPGGFIAKYTSNGNYISHAGLFYAQTTNQMTPNVLRISPNGDFFIGGNTSPDGGHSHGYLLNLNTGFGLKRNWLYESQYFSNVTALSFDGDGDLYVAGDFNGTNENYTGNGSSDVFVSYILNRDDNGAQLWTKTFGSTSADLATAIAIGPSEEAYVIGKFSGTVDFDPSEEILELTGNSFITAFDEDGNIFRSAKAINSGSTTGYNTMATKGNNIYLGGNFQSSFDADPSENETTLTSGGSTDGFFAVMTPEPEVIAYSLDENSPNGTVVGNIKTYGQSNYPSPSIQSGNTDGAFELGEFGTQNELKILVANSSVLDFETNPSYTLRISQGTDYGGSVAALYEISLNDLVEGPEISDQSFTIISTIENGDAVGAISATNSTGDPINVTINSGNTNDAFELDILTRVLTVADVSVLDFSMPNTYTLNVTAQDASGSNSADITIILNTAPVFDWTSTTLSFDENDSWLQSVPVTDSDENALTVTIESGDPDDVLILANNAGVGAGFELWEISPRSGEGIDFETYESFELVIRAEDASGNTTLSEPITININNLNDNTPSLSNQTISISEGLPNGTSVITIEGNDLDGDDPTYSIVSGNTDDAFLLDETSGELSVGNVDALVFDTNPVFSLSISASDGATSETATLTINLVQSPAPIINDQAFSIISTIADADEVGTIEAVDPQGDPINFAITSGNSDNVFALNGTTGVLTLINRSALDFTTSNSYALTVSASDGTDSNSASVTVILNMAPVFNWTATSFSFDENLQWSILNPISDPEEDELTLTIESGNTDNLLTLENTANASTGAPVPDAWEIYPLTASGIDFETHPSFELVIKAEDALGNITLSDPITININNLNDNTPTVSDATVEISEGLPDGSSITSVVATDLDNDPLSYSIVSGNTGAAFSISDATGEITVRTSSALSFSTNPVFNLLVSATDGENAGQATITINLSEASAPVIEDQAFDIVTGISTGDEVGTVEAFDAQGDDITYSITSGNTNDAFELDASTGLLKVADRDALDFSSPNSFSLVISVSDQSGSNSATITIVLNTAPIFNWTATSFDFDENEQWFLTIPVTDDEADDLTFSISSGNENNLLTIVNTASAGTTPVYEITPSAQGIDFEVDQTSFELTIEVTDDAGNTTTSESISISINNVNDNAPETGNKTVAINQNLPNGQAVTTVTGSDADGDALTFAIESGNTDNAFEIDETTGDITVSNSSALVFATNPTFALRVEVSDGLFTSTATITVNLNEQAVNTAPIIANQTFSLAENSENGTSVATIEATDLEGDALTFAIISGNTSNAFLLSSSTGAIIVTNSEVLDFETNPSFSLLVSVSDGALTETATITIDLTDVDEDPVLGFDDSSQAIAIYPNPASNYFQLSLNDEANIRRVVLLDESGKTIKSYGVMIDNQYSLDGIKDGIYFLMIETEDATSSNKLIISK